MVFHPVIATRDHKGPLLRQQGPHNDALLAPGGTVAKIFMDETVKMGATSIACIEWPRFQVSVAEKTREENNLARGRAAPPPRSRQA